MPGRHAFTVLAIAVALAVAGGVAALALHHGGADARKAQRTAKLDAGGKKTYAQLTAANYRILKPRQTARLLRYADAAYSCTSKPLDLRAAAAARDEDRDGAFRRGRRRAPWLSSAPVARCRSATRRATRHSRSAGIR